ncbi:Mn2+/Fe2+ transporter [Natronorubrum sp. FCH18a]|uniref:Mn2+/Fe2+ transporter n=1 Tax=Natronorubrum sp. FCH18a TaxID=3447018 RepID=UPI003F5109CA
MLSEGDFSDDVVVGGVLVTFAAIGLIGTGQTANGGVAVTWLWLGIGLSVTYLLYRLVATLERLVETL